jgi:hypothetical protein
MASLKYAQWPSVVDEDVSRWAMVVAKPRKEVNF